MQQFCNCAWCRSQVSFVRFPSWYATLARRLDKSVNLVTRGETTESDKTIVDLLFEPLMHLVRNALDHGIETAGAASRAGKTARSPPSRCRRPEGEIALSWR